MSPVPILCSLADWIFSCFRTRAENMGKPRGYVNYQMEGIIAVVMIDRPPVNALNRQVQEEIEETFKELLTLSQVGAVIITGGGEKIFVAGADIKMSPEADTEGAFQIATSTQAVLNLIEEFHSLVIAALNGSALGGGLELALACDIRVAEEHALFGFPEVCLGLLPGAGGTQRLARLVGPGKAKELILTGDPITASEAKAIGLVERLVPKGSAVGEARKIAERVLLRGPLAVASAKKAITHAVSQGLKEGLELEARLFSQLFNTQDKKEGVAAFIEKRKPKFLGR
jgi:enoyl-CoA hydratase